MASDALRVALIIQDLGSGGAERQLMLLANALAARGAAVHVAIYDANDHFARDLSPAVRFVRLRRGPLSAALPASLRAWWAEADPHVVISFLTGSTRWVGLSMPRGRRWKWVVAERSLPSQGVRVPGYLALSRRADLVVANSWSAVRELEAAGMRDTRYLPNGIPVPPPPGPREPGPLRILAVGSVQALKNHRLLVAALARLPTRDWVFDHVGRPEERELARAIAEDVRQMGLGDRVRLHGELRDVAAFYRRADLMVLPSAYEGFPNVLLEAWSHGCAALVSDRCDLPVLVRHGETGWVFPLGEPDGLERALAEVVGLGLDRIRAAGAAGYAEVRAKYSMEAVAGQWHDLLLGLVGGGVA